MSKLKTHSGNGGSQMDPQIAKKMIHNISGLGFENPALVINRNFETAGLPEEDDYELQQQQEALIAAADSGLARPAFPFPTALKALKNGCYFATYQPASSLPVSIFRGFYQGTIRVEKTASFTKASGDLYFVRPVFALPGTIPAPSPNPAGGIPIFSRGSYTYYLRITNILQGFTISGSFQMNFQMHKFNHTAKTFSLETSAKAKMAWTTAPAGFPDAGQYLKGEVKDATGRTIGTLFMGWVDKYFRKATIEIDSVAGSEHPLDSGTGETWQTVGNKVGWRFNVINSNRNIVQRSGESWSDAEMHAEMLASRDLISLDREWRYHILCVKKLDSTSRGIMYDNGGTDSNNVPREGVGISSHWVIPNADPWGLVKGIRFGTAKAPYFRTAVHEIGHAMELYHNTIDLGFLNTTDVIAAAGTASNPFPNNIKWNYAPNDQDRLRHFPDVAVRPGGIPFGVSHGSIPISDLADETADAVTDQAGLFDEMLQLNVTPVREVFPLGAPVRLDFTISNISHTEMEIPADLSMKKADVYGFVTDPAGTKRSFSPLMHCADLDEMQVLKPGKNAGDSVTLLRGKEGPLFRQAGYHTIELNVAWDINGIPVNVKGNCSVMVTPATEDEHAKVAKAIFDNADTHLVLVLGGDHLTDAVRVIQQALDNKVLRPHYAYIEAKRVGKPFGARKAQKDKAKSILQKDAVLNNVEKQKVPDLLK
jgi:hypothetical protein